MSNRPKAYHDKGWIGLIDTEDTYESVKTGKADWKPHLKPKMKAVTIPVELFYRLMELDKATTTIPFECDVIKGGEG